MQDKSMIFTLNGEILITTKGSELCFTDFDAEDGKKGQSRKSEDEVTGKKDHFEFCLFVCLFV